jgi:hypothetical protein
MSEIQIIDLLKEIIKNQDEDLNNILKETYWINEKQEKIIKLLEELLKVLE